MKTVEYEHYLASILAENHHKIILSIVFQRFMLKFQSIRSCIKYDTRSSERVNNINQSINLSFKKNISVKLKISFNFLKYLP